MDSRVADNVHFFMEAGLGEILSREHPDPGGYIHFSSGVHLNAGQHGLTPRPLNLGVAFDTQITLT